MPDPVDTSVLIVGARPVGLTLAIDLAWRGVDVTLVERRRAGEPQHARSNQVSARSMEIFRRLGIADSVRDVGLPADYPNDVVCRTTVTGIELSRVVIPSRAERSRGDLGAGWLVADAGAAASDQPGPSRAGAVRACGIPAVHPHPRPHRGRGPVPGRGRRHGDGPRSRHRRAAVAALQLPGRLRRRQVGRCARRSAPRFAAHRRSSACSRPASARRSSCVCCPESPRLAVPLVQPAPLRDHDRGRRTRDLADPQLALSGRARLRFRRS